MQLDVEKQKYDAVIGLRNKETINAVLCQEGVGKLFEDIWNEEKYICFYCCDGDKTAIRADDISYLISRKKVSLTEGVPNEA
jgi:hypothetical protein